MRTFSAILLVIASIGPLYSDAEPFCKFTHYGKDCAKKCSCPVGRICRATDGACLCPQGLVTKGCKQKCPAGYYGDKCEEKCSSRCTGGVCDQTTGLCGTVGVSLRYNRHGSRKVTCIISGHPNRYDMQGMSVSFPPNYVFTYRAGKSTSLHSLPRQWSFTKSPGILAFTMTWSNVQCTDEAKVTCTAEFIVQQPGNISGLRQISTRSIYSIVYDKACQKCGNNCENRACVDGYSRPCKCHRGFYGPGCPSRCNVNCPYQRCSKDGDCEIDCGGYHFGMDCDQKCSCPKGILCSSANGSCICPYGQTGEDCNQDCQKGFYGYQCQKQCTSACPGGVCHKVAGYCGCTNGMWGAACAHVCSEECPNDCDPETGLCTSERRSSMELLFAGIGVALGMAVLAGSIGALAVLKRRARKDLS